MLSYELHKKNYKTVCSDAFSQYEDSILETHSTEYTW